MSSLALQIQVDPLIGHLGTPVNVSGLTTFLDSDDETFLTGESTLFEDERSQVMQDDLYRGFL